MSVTGLDHFQIAIPAGGEDEVRRFYIGYLGFEEVPRPAQFDGRGGLWMVAGTANLHIGVDPDFRPQKKGHPAFLVADTKALRTRLEADGFPTADDVPIDGYRRFFTADPFGNRIELMDKTG